MASPKAEGTLSCMKKVKSRSIADDAKCDEARPCCSSCEHRGVVCSYSNLVSDFINLHGTNQGSPGTDSNAVPASKRNLHDGHQVILAVRSSKLPPRGNGRYHTFKPLDAVTKERIWRTKQRPRQKLPSPSPSVMYCTLLHLRACGFDCWDDGRTSV